MAFFGVFEIASRSYLKNKSAVIASEVALYATTYNVAIS